MTFLHTPHTTPHTPRTRASNNGFGRIGRNVARIAMEHPEVEEEIDHVN